MMQPILRQRSRIQPSRLVPRITSNGILFGTVLIAIAGNGCGEKGKAEEPAPQERAHNVRVLEVQRSDLEEFLLITGPLRADRATDVSTEESGVVEAIPHDKGDVVQEGDVVVLLDRRLLEAEMKSSEAAVTLRDYNYDRTKSLLDANSVSKQEMLKVHTEREQARQAAEVAKLRYQRAAIKAPFDGIVADRMVEVGQLVNPGRVVARVVNSFVLKLAGWVTEREVRYLREGSPALVSVEGEEAPRRAEVSWVAPEANPVNGKFAVEIRIENHDLALRAGVVGRARVLKTLHRDVVAIPRDALVRGVEGTVVYAVEGDRAQPHRVEVGSDQGMMVVIESGLDPGARLVVRGQRELSPGSLVDVQEVATHRDGSVDDDPPEVREEGSLRGILEQPSPAIGVRGSAP